MCANLFTFLDGEEIQIQKEESLPFDSALWKEGAVSGSKERAAMLEDLMSIDSLRFASVSDAML